MNSRDFVYWLQGYFELAGGSCNLNKEQVDVIKEHLKLVLAKETKEIVINTNKAIEGAEELKKMLEKHNGWPAQDWNTPKLTC